MGQQNASYKRQNTRQIGTYNENLAVEYLQEKKYCILEQNFRCRLGEIDVIALHQGQLVFVEVKYRASSEHGQPVVAVNRQKQMRISNVASYYRFTHPQYRGWNCRFDVVSIVGKEIHLYQNAFAYCGKYFP